MDKKIIPETLVILLLVILFLAGCNGSDKDNASQIIAGGEIDNHSAPDNAVKDNPINELVVDKHDGPGENETGANASTLVVEEPAELQDLKVSFIDVRHGDSIFIQTPNNSTMLIDGGYNDQGSNVIRYLRDHGAQYYLDVMLLTHPDMENVGGLDGVLYNLYGVFNVYDNGQGASGQSYEAFEEFSRAKGDLTTVTEDMSIELDESMDIQVIVPYMDGYLNGTNDNSLVVKASYGDVKFLLMGDCGFECEKKIMGHDLKADIIKIAHSGANDSTSQALLDEVDPKIAIISTGDTTEYGHPNAEVLELLKKNNIEILRTDYNGTIVITSDGRTYGVETSK